MKKHNKEEIEILGGKATIYTNAYGVWQFRLWLTTDNKYVRKSLRTKVKDYAITKGKKLYIKIRRDLEKGIKYFAITVKEAVEEYLKHQKTRIGYGDFNIVEGRYNTIDTQMRTFLNYVRKEDKINVLDESTLVRYDRNGEITNYVAYRKAKGISDITIRNEMVTINNFIKYCFTNVRVTNISAFKYPPLPKKDNDIDCERTRRDTLTIEKLNTITNSMQTKKNTNRFKGNAYLTQFSINVQDQFVYFPYSIGCIWAYAEQMGTVTRDNLGGLFFVKEPINKLILKFYNPSIVGFSNYMWNEGYNDALAREIKARWPKCIIMYGGPQVPDKITDWHNQHHFVDICIHQEGEISFNSIMAGDDLDNIPGITYNRNGEWYQTGPSKRIMNLEEIQSPYLIGLFDNLQHSGCSVNAILETDRGCPYKCTFCDWGGTTFSKVKRFGLDRVYAEIEWVGKNKIEMLNSSNANFGIFKERDSLIVEKIIEVKQKYGYPKLFETSWAKNSNQDVLDLAIKLEKNGLLRKFGISVQSTEPKVLENIKRSNMKINDFDDILQKAKKHNIAVMVETIVGLPGETYNSYTENYIDLLKHTNVSIDSYPLSLLNNSEMYAKEYILKHGIKWQWVDNSFGEHNIPEKDRQVTSTGAMPEIDMQKVWQWVWCTRLGHMLGITYDICNELVGEGYADYKKFYNDWLSYIQTSSGILNEEFSKSCKYLKEHKYNHYLYHYDFIDNLCDKRRTELKVDLISFLKSYYPEVDCVKYCNIFDMHYYDPNLKYPIKKNGYKIMHNGVGNMDSLSSFVGLTRKRQGWRCQIS